MFDQKTEQAFNQIFKTDDDRMADYYMNQAGPKGPYIMKFYHNGAEDFSYGGTIQECFQRARIKNHFFAYVDVINVRAHTKPILEVLEDE